MEGSDRVEIDATLPVGDIPPTEFTFGGECVQSNYDKARRCSRDYPNTRFLLVHRDGALWLLSGKALGNFVRAHPKMLFVTVRNGMDEYCNAYTLVKGVI